MSTSSTSKVIPAHLNFLAIYNPELGRTEETERDQIVFYFSGKSEKRRRGDHDAPSGRDIREEEDEQMRQIGLAQGVVNFAKSFSGDEDVDSIDTEKHRIVVTELETGWWILASIALTVLPRQAMRATALDPQGLGSIEYSAREITPAQLLLQQLHRAHKIFLLHHSPTLSDHYMRLPRHQFTALLANFWTSFAQNWDVLLHGNPAVEAYDGIKLAAGGELGVGVGEEEWGSGEREVLEDTIRRTEGLVDIVVSRFGDAPGTIAQKMNAASSATKADELAAGGSWLGCLEHAGPADGILFSGCGALSRQSLHGLAAWMEWIYTYGESVYGVRDNPTSTRRKRPRRSVPQKASSPKELSPVPEPDDEREQPSPGTLANHLPSIPPPIVTAAEEALESATKSAVQHEVGHSSGREASAQAEGWTNYLTLGYGSRWFGGGTKSLVQKTTKPKSTSPAETKKANPISDKSSIRSALSQDSNKDPLSITAIPTTPPARFLIGLQGSLAEPGAEIFADEDQADAEVDRRIMIRTAYVEVSQSNSEEDSVYDSDDSHGSVSPGMMPARLSKWKRLRLVIYVVSCFYFLAFTSLMMACQNQPFMFVFLFEPTTESLNMPLFFRRLHTNLLPLYKPLLSSTSPVNVARRLESIVSPTLISKTNDTNASSSDPSSSLATNPIYDLIYSPAQMTIHSSIPNIPLPNTLAAHGIPTALTSATPYTTPTWTRIEALNVHAQILNSWIATRKRGGSGGQAHKGELERSAKTGKGWWVCWLKIEVDEDPVHDTKPEEAESSRAGTNDAREPESDNPSARPGLGLGLGGATIMSYETQRQASYREAVLISTLR